MDPKTLAHLQFCEEQAGEQLLGLGIWGDEVPCNWDRSESVAVLGMNMPGLTGDFAKLRLPLTAVPHKQVGENTWDDIFGVISWSLTLLATGSPCVERHDKKDWLPSDRVKKKRNPGRSTSTSQSIEQRCALVEVRMDWPFLCKVFGFPAHNTKAGCCWVCRCTLAQVI
jgi:hypothetical protein